MSDAAFIHYVVCKNCRRQIRIDAPGDWVATFARGRVVGVRCCDTVWVNQGVTVGEIEVSLAGTAKAALVDALKATGDVVRALADRLRGVVAEKNCAACRLLCKCDDNRHGCEQHRSREAA